MKDVISILKTVRKCMKIGFLDTIIEFLNQIDQTLSNLANLEKSNKKLQFDLNVMQKQKQNYEKDIILLKLQIKEKEIRQNNDEMNYPKEFLTKIAELKNSDDFESVYKFFDDLSLKGDQKLMKKACSEGLSEKKAKQKKRNILLAATERGNLRLVKSLIEGGCNKEATDIFGSTALFYAASEGFLEIAKYLISINASIAAHNIFGDTPLIYASRNDQSLEVVKYFISLGVNKEEKNYDGKTALQLAAPKVKEYLLSLG